VKRRTSDNTLCYPSDLCLCERSWFSTVSRGPDRASSARRPANRRGGLSSTGRNINGPATPRADFPNLPFRPDHRIGSGIVRYIYFWAVGAPLILR
jgi:hypothetical protein